MGIAVEFNPDLCLRAHGTVGRDIAECLPEKLEVDGVYSFFKKGQRNYWLEGEVPLRETRGEGRLSRPVASVLILRAEHRLINGAVWTEGEYKVNGIFDPSDSKIYFEGCERVR
jgi:hypothetical protein